MGRCFYHIWVVDKTDVKMAAYWPRVFFWVGGEGGGGGACLWTETLLRSVTLQKKSERKQTCMPCMLTTP